MFASAKERVFHYVLHFIYQLKGTMPPGKKHFPPPYTHLASDEVHDLLMNHAVLLYKAELKPSAIKAEPPADEEDQLPKVKRRRIEVPTPPPSSPPIKLACSPPFTPRTNTVKPRHELLSPSTPFSQRASASKFLTVFSPMHAANSRRFTVNESQISVSKAQLGLMQSVVWFARPSGEQGCSEWLGYYKRVSEQRKIKSLRTFLQHCGWLEVPQSRGIRYGIIIVDECHETKGPALWEKTLGLIRDAKLENKNPACLPIYIIGCCDDPDKTFCYD
ncbi:hypothetical protein BJ165DRAFT_1590310 [Panaeolus papilionaceus]|nr:hypothetical protein BJ165DRAFT_1590310 [Panaeolus papilionaceus]